MIRRIAAFAAALMLVASTAFAHAGFRASDPAPGASLDDPPKTIRLTFSEPPDPALAQIHVTDANGATYQTSRPSATSGDRFSVTIPVSRLNTGVYIVNWRALSAIDGHATTGTFVFGVRTDPSRVRAGSTSASQVSTLEFVARWIFLSGVILVLGAACATIARFGGPDDRTLASTGCAVAWLGLAMLAIAQQRTGGMPTASLGRAIPGGALTERAAALLLTTAALVTARSTALRRRPLVVAALGSVAAMFFHVHAGHGAVSRFGHRPGVAAQLLHIAMSGVWFGGLAALLAALRRTDAAGRTTIVRRFSRVAAVCLAIVVMTGAFRGLDEIVSWQELTSTPYGRVILGKIALAIAIVVLGAVNRWRSVPRAATSARLVTRVGGAELGFATIAIAAAALLATLAPPASARVPSISASGVDFGTTVRAGLTTASDQPGMNRFRVAIADYDSGAPVRARRVSLQFVPLDDPDVAATALPLVQTDDAYEGSGANIAFEGRWRVTVLVERERDSVQIPIDVTTSTRPQFVSIVRIPGQKPAFTVQVGEFGHIRFTLDAERPGPQGLEMTCFDVEYKPNPLVSLVVTATAPKRLAQQLPIDRTSGNVFHTTVELTRGDNVLVAVGRMHDGSRMRAEVHVAVPPE